MRGGWLATAVLVCLLSVAPSRAQQTSPQPAGSVTVWVAPADVFTSGVRPDDYQGATPIRLDLATPEGQQIAAAVRECYRNADWRDHFGKSSNWIRVDEGNSVYDAVYLFSANRLLVQRRPVVHAGSSSRNPTTHAWFHGPVPRSFQRNMLKLLPPDLRQKAEADIRANRHPPRFPAGALFVGGVLLFAIVALVNVWRDFHRP